MRNNERMKAKPFALSMILKSKLLMSALALSLSLFSMHVIADVSGTTQPPPDNFTHLKTGFPLTGAHLNTECAACHLDGVFKGTPRNCSGCHSKGMRITAATMPLNHLVTNDPCETCHTNTVTFIGARFNHGNAQPGYCTTCHNGQIAAGKPSSHSGGLRVTDSCERCHRTIAWIPSRFNHTGIMPGTCATQCHNGILAAGKPGSHTTALKSTSACDTCHRFSAWFPTFYNHTSVVPGSCQTCHNGATATSKPSNHTGLKASLSCDQCHNTFGWMPARYNHLGVAPGSCSTCHNGSSAAGRPTNHSGAKASMPCDSCHNTTAWLPAQYNHIGVAPGMCLTCHAAQRPTSHTARGYTGSCDACHSIGSRWTFNHALQQGKHTCNICHSGHNNSTPCDYCHSVSKWH